MASFFFLLGRVPLEGLSLIYIILAPLKIEKKTLMLGDFVFI